MSEAKLERWSGRADIAWCDEHGLHGARSHCFECGKPVEQIPMVPLSDVEPLLGQLRAFAHGPAREPESLERALGLIAQVEGDAADALAAFEVAGELKEPNGG